MHEVQVVQPCSVSLRLLSCVLQAEADMAAALFVELCTFMRDAAAKQGKQVALPSVGVVTPYRFAPTTLMHKVLFRHCNPGCGL